MYLHGQIAVKDDNVHFNESSSDFRFASSVAGFGMLLRGSEHRGNWTYEDVGAVAELSKGADSYGLRQEFVELVAMAESLDPK